MHDTVTPTITSRPNSRNGGTFETSNEQKQSIVVKFDTTTGFRFNRRLRNTASKLVTSLPNIFQNPCNKWTQVATEISITIIGAVEVGGLIWMPLLPAKPREPRFERTMTINVAKPARILR